jgi:3D (Asp-Asp-Asp) domain-containing protein
MRKLHRHIKRHYKKIACTLAGAACLSVLVPNIPAPGNLPAPAAKPLGPDKAPTPVTGQAVPPAEKGGPQTAPATQELVTRVKEAMPSPARSQLPDQATPPPDVSHTDEAAPTREAEKTAPLTEPAPTVRPEQNKAPEANAERVLEMTATAYAPGPQDNDQWGTKTHIGTEVRPGIIAVDPRVIPLGSRVMIKYPDGHKEYAVAEDTGGAIKGRRIDVAKWTVGEAKQFGIKAVKVYVLETPAPKEERG